MIIGSHVPFLKEKQLLGSVEFALLMGENAFMFYTGAPQNTVRLEIDKKLTDEAHILMKDNNIDLKNVIVHAPYIINLANNKIDKNYRFAKEFLKDELRRCEMLGVKKLVLHPGSSVGLSFDVAITNIIDALNEVLEDSNVIILLETMAGKGSEVGKDFLELKQIISKVKYQDKIGICLDTCHLNDAGYDISNFDLIIEELKKHSLFDKVLCIHLNDSKNFSGSRKDRHENIGYGTIGFENILKILYHDELADIPKILETPYIDKKPPYKEEISMLKEKSFFDIK